MQFEIEDKIVTNPRSTIRRSVSIWFPPRNGTVKRSYIVAPHENFHGFWGVTPLRIYALYGWLDVEIEYGGDWYKHGGIIHCN